MPSGKFHSGDQVTVRSPEEILSTLDADGTLDGLPFMPEMLEWCGKSLRVERRAEKTCVSVPLPAYGNRRFAANDVVILDGLRCDGQSHDGCTRGCMVFWKEDWLRHARSTDPPTSVGAPRGVDALVGRLKTKTDENHYFCQSTQLYDATEAFPGDHRLWMLRVAWQEIRNGDRAVSEIVRMLVLWSRLQFLHRLLPGRVLRGRSERTPTESLGLEAGDLVRVKSRAEVEPTLDQQRSNRGLKMGDEMTRFFGRRLEVKHRVGRIIDEQTGEMRELHDTVALRHAESGGDLGCLCSGQLGDCPRDELMYWREIWLDRANGNAGEPAATPTS